VSLKVDDFLNRTKQLPGYGLQSIQVVQAENRIIACAGLWDYSAIFRVRVLHVSARLMVLAYLLRFINLFTNTAKLPSVGEPFKLMYIRDFAFTREAARLSELMDHCLSWAFSYGCNFLSVPLDPADPIIRAIAKYRPIRVAFHVYAKSLKKKAFCNPKMMFVDPIDL
jgi:hypothetical protein